MTMWDDVHRAYRDYLTEEQYEPAEIRMSTHTVAHLATLVGGDVATQGATSIFGIPIVIREGIPFGVVVFGKCAGADIYARHEGECCESCLQDKAEGYGDDLYDVCCCYEIKEGMTRL